MDVIKKESCTQLEMDTNLIVPINMIEFQSENG